MRQDQIIQLLTKRNILTSEQLHQADDEIKRTGLSLVKVLEKMGIISQDQLIQLIAEDIGVPFVDITSYLIDTDLIKLVPKRLAQKYKLMPLFKVKDTLTLAMVNPKDIVATDEVKQITGIENIETVLASEDAVTKAIQDYYAENEKIADVLKNVDSEEEYSAHRGEREELSVVKIVNLIFNEAMKARASDVHIEPEKDTIRLRYRIDGVLHEMNTFPKHLQNAVTSRIKLMADMDIAESRLPQDGKIAFKSEGRELDIRVSTFPTVYGENIVMRLLDKTSVILGLNQLGFSKNDLTRFETLVRFPFGIILVTGPTGSGKTTTLYAILNAINSMTKNIITVEDPVEYEIPLIRQTQVNLKTGLTFARGLRAILRQDPDVIMVGEIRDPETAEVAIQAALTGHLVLSTLHTNDAPSAITRLIDMGVEPFLISSAVIGFLSQRLVRVICRKCKEEYAPSGEIKEKLRPYHITKLNRGQGCPACKHTGFLGRIGLFELLLTDDTIKSMIIRKASAEELRAEAVKLGMRTLYEDGMDKVKQGVTSLEEVLRVARMY